MKFLKKELCQFPSNLNMLDQVLAWFNQLNQPFIPINVWLKCELALAEWFTNVVRHAHKGMPLETPIDMEITICPEYLEMRIWDFGQFFDLEAYFKNLPETVNPNNEGGRGIPILFQIADKLSYTHAEKNRNCLLIVKNYNLNGDA